jgi:hypothetical protein
MTGFYGQPPLGQSPWLMGAHEGMGAQDTYGQDLPVMLPAEGLAQALQTSSAMPQSMNPSPSPGFKPQYPVTNSVSMYARGGHVQREKPLWRLADAVRASGEDEDKILAHINPEEAAFLAKHFGGDINPETGLPQFGLFSSIGKFFKKIVGPVGGAIVGNMILPGVGGMIGGGIGGMFGHPKQRMGPLAGAGVGQLGLTGLNALGSGASSLGYSGLGGGLKSLGGPNYISSLMNSVSPTAASYLGPQAQLPGLGGFFGGGSGGSAAASQPFSMNPVSQLASTLAGNGGATAAGGGLGSFLGGGLLNNALLATALGGTLMRREKPQGPQSIGEAMREAEKHRWRADQYPDKNSFKPINRKYKAHANHYRPGFDGEEEDFMEDSPWQYTPRFSQGGFLDGASSGQDDTVPALLSEGEYVIPADVVADLGDGNSKSGAKRLGQMIAEVRRHKNTQDHPPKAKGLSAYFNA